MNDTTSIASAPISQSGLLNLSRRGFLGASLGTLVLGVSVSGGRKAFAQAPAPAAAGTNVNAYIEIRPDSSVLFRSAFIEGGQGIFTAMAQIVGEELDVDPSRFDVEVAPPGPDYLLIGNIRITGGSMSVRMSYDRMRALGASARMMVMQAAATRLSVPLAELSTEPGRVLHAASGRALTYGELAADAAALPIPAGVPLRSKADFRWIGKPVARLDVHDKSTGKVQYTVDLAVDNMLHAAVQHARHLGAEPLTIANEPQVLTMPGVHSVHKLAGAVAVVADSWWRAKRAAESLQVEWSVPPAGTKNTMPADFSSQAHMAKLKSMPSDGAAAETVGDVAKAMAGAKTVIEATYDAPYLAHAQMEPPSALARWNEDGTLDLWLPNQAPEMFQGVAAQVAGIDPSKVIIHSPLLGGFFGRHFLYASANPFPQAILLAKAVGRPVKLMWSREEEFLRDALRPMTMARFKAGLGENGLPVALTAVTAGEGPAGRWLGRQPDKVDSTAIEGIADKHYAIADRRIGHIHVDDPAIIGFWRSVGHSMNDFFYEAFFDEMADAGKQDPFALRHTLLADSPRQQKLLEAVGELSGGWKRGPYQAEDGTRRARGIAMASPFGSEVATIAEVSLNGSDPVVHHIWVAIDPGSVVNPAIVEAQVNSAVAIGLSTALMEEVVYENGVPLARNYDGYPILPPDRMPKVHVRIVESGAPMGGIGEPGVPGVPPAVVNALAVLTGQRVRSLPLSRSQLTGNI